MTNKYAIYDDKGKRVSNWVSSIVADVLKRKLEKVNYGKKYYIKKAEDGRGGSQLIVVGLFFENSTK